MGITSCGCSKYCWPAAVTKKVPVHVCTEENLKLEFLETFCKDNISV